MRFWILFGWIVALASGARVLAADAADVAPTGEALIQRVVERVEKGGGAVAESRLLYRTRKTVFIEQLDKTGEVEDSESKTYEVIYYPGKHLERLIFINGKAPPESVRKKEEAKVKRFQQSLAESSDGRDRDRFDDFVSEKVANRFDYAVTGREWIAGRLAYIVTFQPKPGPLPEKELQDRLINRLVGKVWVDAADAEVVRMDVKLDSEIELWGGIVGVLRAMNVTILRGQLPDGRWVVNGFAGAFTGRKLLAAMNTRVRTEYSEPFVADGVDAVSR